MDFAMFGENEEMYTQSGPADGEVVEGAEGVETQRLFLRALQSETELFKARPLPLPSSVGLCSPAHRFLIIRHCRHRSWQVSSQSGKLRQRLPSVPGLRSLHTDGFGEAPFSVINIGITTTT